MIVELRSDTLTLPTPAMRRCMAEAEVGDDVFEEDPTVQRLESEVAALLGKEAGLFVPSGTMANQIAIRCLTEPGDEAIMEAGAHPFHYEAGGAAAISGVTIRLVTGIGGHLNPALVRGSVRSPNVHHAHPSLLSIENTANRGGGTVLGVAQSAALVETGRSLVMKLHLDGARLWNAAAALQVPEAELAAGFDLACVCFSKGLGAPVGSLIAGTSERIKKARKVRKMLGGGMRQVGILAAGALYAVHHHRARLVEDHGRALNLWEGLRAAGWEAERPQTNMVYVKADDAPALSAKLAESGIRCIALSMDQIRLVTHLGVDDAGIEHTISVLRQLRQA